MWTPRPPRGRVGAGRCCPREGPSGPANPRGQPNYGGELMAGDPGRTRPRTELPANCDNFVDHHDLQGNVTPLVTAWGRPVHLQADNKQGYTDTPMTDKPRTETDKKPDRPDRRITGKCWYCGEPIKGKWLCRRCREELA